MADKAISELTAAEQIKSTDMFVLEQDGTAKRLQGQTLLNWLTAAADGHGGIKSITKTGTSGLADTYTITLADNTTMTFTVTNGNGLTAFEKTGTVGLVDTYRFTRTDGTYFTFAVSNGAKGDTGDASHVWIKYASQQPTAASHSMGDEPDDWMGVYSGTAESAPDDWQDYTWYQIKGEKGDTGAPATVSSTAVEYMVSDSGTVAPTGSWSATVPTVPQGKYLWTRVTTTFNSGNPVVSYSVTRMGIDGSGSVSSVNSQSPDENGNVAITASDIAADGNESVQAALDAKQPTLTPGQNITINNNTIGTKVFPCNPNLLDNWYFGNPVNQRGQTSYIGGSATSQIYSIDRWKATGALTVGDSYISVTNATNVPILRQWIEYPSKFKQKTMTFSVQVAKAVSSLSLFIRYNDYATVVTKVFSSLAAGDVVSITGAIPDVGLTELFVQAHGIAGQELALTAVKLELGTEQTLAHQDANGNWVLNEIPNYGEQLRRCQRYYYRLYHSSMFTFVAPFTTNNAGNRAAFSLRIPQMRTVPTITGKSGTLYIKSSGGNGTVVLDDIDIYVTSNFETGTVLTFATSAYGAAAYGVCAMDVAELAFSADL